VRLAAVDIGTNTVRLLVADHDGGDLVHVEHGQRITRLGQGVDASGELAEEAIARTIDAVRVFVERAREMGAERIRVAGTSALRDAKRPKAFANAVRDATGFDLEILEGSHEGRLAYDGATSWLDDGAYVVCDIGGGSTELITATDAVSVDIGSVRVRERFLHTDPPTPDEVRVARGAIRTMIDAYGRQLAGDERLVGVAGTITTLAALAAGLAEYASEVVHGYQLTREAVADWADRLNRLTAEEISALGPVSPGRADVIGAGALVCEAVVDSLDASELLVSERDILDGLLLGSVR
jgi:exopolyphosphatase / guanosine-5'-triphosphate,3'-diphosphate pyrophosphatase